MLTNAQSSIEALGGREMSNYGDQDVKCPYYRRRETSGRMMIVCEGIVGDTAAHRFRSGVEADAHFRQFCCGRYKCCPHGDALEKKWWSEP